MAHRLRYKPNSNAASEWSCLALEAQGGYSTVLVQPKIVDRIKLFAALWWEAGIMEHDAMANRCSWQAVEPV